MRSWDASKAHIRPGSPLFVGAWRKQGNSQCSRWSMQALRAARASSSVYLTSEPSGKESVVYNAPASRCSFLILSLSATPSLFSLLLHEGFELLDALEDLLLLCSLQAGSDSPNLSVADLHQHGSYTTLDASGQQVIGQVLQLALDGPKLDGGTASTAPLSAFTSRSAASLCPVGVMGVAIIASRDSYCSAASAGSGYAATSRHSYHPLPLSARNVVYTTGPRCSSARSSRSLCR